MPKTCEPLSSECGGDDTGSPSSRPKIHNTFTIRTQSPPRPPHWLGLFYTHPDLGLLSRLTRIIPLRLRLFSLFATAQVLEKVARGANAGSWLILESGWAKEWNSLYSRWPSIQPSIYPAPAQVWKPWLKHIVPCCPSPQAEKKITQDSDSISPPLGLLAE